MNPKDIVTAFGMTPEKAVEYLKGKGYKITNSWREMLQQAHERAFTIAGVLEMDLLEFVKGELVRAQEEGLPYAEIADRLKERFTEAGYAPGQGVNTPSRLATVYRQNLQTAYMAGRFQQQQDVIASSADLFPFFELVVTDDDRTSDICFEYIGKVYPSSLAGRICPPFHFLCRTRRRLISAMEAERRGLKANAGLKQAPSAPGFEGPPVMKYKPDLSNVDPRIANMYKNRKKP